MKKHFSQKFIRKKKETFLRKTSPIIGVDFEDSSSNCLNKSVFPVNISSIVENKI